MRGPHWILLALLAFGQPLCAQERSANPGTGSDAGANLVFAQDTATPERAQTTDSDTGGQTQDTARAPSRLPATGLQTDSNASTAPAASAGLSAQTTGDTDGAATETATGAATGDSSVTSRESEPSGTADSAPREEHSTSPVPATPAAAPQPAQSVETAPAQIAAPPSQRQIPSKKIPPQVQRNNSGHLLNQPPPAPPPLRKTSAKDLPPLRQILVAAADLQTAEQQRRQLAALDLRITSRKVLDNLGLVISVFKLPEDADPQALRESVESLLGQTAELNQRYRLLAGDRRSYAQAMVGSGAPSHCRQSPLLAMLDSRVNPDSGGLGGDRVRVEDITGTAEPHAHGTGIASLLVSDHPQFPGLLPRARLLAVNVFADDGRGEQETRTDWLLAGLDRIAAAEPVALNLSFGGVYSALLEQTFERLAKNMLLVAAAGNGGGEEQVYPAAYTSVYAVGGLDARGRPTRRSNRGAHVQLFAPGEDIWTTDGKGGGVYASGTSFATPFATAALALAKNNGLSPSGYIASLESKRVDFRPLCTAG